MHVRSTDDPQQYLDAAAGHLASDPVGHNVHLTVAAESARRGLSGRYWWVEYAGHVVGTAMRSDEGIPLSLGPMHDDVTVVLARAVADQAPDLDSVIGVAATAASFAGTWASARRTPAAPAEGQRIYRCTSVAPRTVGLTDSGWARPASDDDTDLMVEWCDQFARETHGSLGDDTTAMVEGIIEAGTGWVWEDAGEPVAMLRATVPAHGVSRVGMVYTATGHRRHGHAEALVADVTGQLLAGGVDAAMLFTQLSNPTSNAIYQRVGYEPVAEILRYQFG
jgi:predicted GNAT family acetyltransferase